MTSTGTWRLICALLVLHNIIHKCQDRERDMDGWEDDGDLLEMDMEASAAARRVLGGVLRTRGTQPGRKTGSMRASAKLFREDLLDAILYRRPLVEPSCSPVSLVQCRVVRVSINSLKRSACALSASAYECLGKETHKVHAGIIWI